MKFGPLPPAEAQGAILAHSLSVGDGRKLKKGRILSAEDCAALAASGFDSVIVACPEAGDCPEDEAARRVAAALAGPGLSATAPFTGRVNLVADEAGLVILERARVDAVNLIDEAVTLATLEPFEPVQPKQLVATVKIIPFAAPEAAVAQAEAVARAGPIRLAPFRAKRAGLIQTELAGLKPSVLDKTAAILADRLLRVGGELAREERCAHAPEPLRARIERQLADGLSPILIAGASAITDRRDVIPAAIEAAGGAVEHYGMPVDPGNLMLLGRVGAVPVIGLPGCARSPKPNGFDWVLHRLAADLAVTRADIMRMGAGGLLKEIPSRPQPRGEPTARAPRSARVGAILLAAGQSRRMGAANKLLEPLAGRPMAAHGLNAALAARLEKPVLVVTGHEAERVEAALAGPDRRFLRNPRFEAGLSASLAAGLAAVPDDWDGVVVMLGDMPGIEAAHLDRLIAAFNPVEGRAIVVPTHRGKRGNPVLWARRFFDAMAGLSGDAGAKHLIGEHEDLVAEVEIGAPAVVEDVDTPDGLAGARARITS